MVEKSVFIQYREDGALINADEVVLEDRNATFGIKQANTGDVLVAAGTAVSNPSTGVYEYTAQFEEDITYTVSWKITVSSTPRYVVQTVGPFSGSADVRAVADFRGKLAQNTVNNLFFKAVYINGDAADTTDLSIVITNEDGDEIELNGTTETSGTPDRISLGYYAFQWTIPFDLPAGTYTATWGYKVDGEDREEVQTLTVAATGGSSLLYSGRVFDMRMGLQYKIHACQNIPVYNEQSKETADRRKYSFTFDKWNQSAGVRIYRNGKIVTSGFEVNYYRGYVLFDSPLTKYDRVNADYNFRWFSDEELDRFLSDSLHILNSYPPVERKSLMNVDDRFIPHILYGAAIDALRSMMLSDLFQQPALVFGNPEMAKSKFADMETLKKNYEEVWKELLDKKKLLPYRGLTRMITTPPFALPGGRSRWFRYLFSGGGG